MRRRFYLRPLPLAGFHRSRYDPERTEIIEKLAGRDDLGFTHLELIDRTPAGAFARILLASWGQGGFSNEDWYHPPFDGADLWRQFDRLIEPRPAVGGLAMDHPHLMGIVNVTPDSFSDGGSFSSTASAIEHGLRLASEGAAILDVGGESTRPGSDAVPLETELARVLPVIEGLVGKTGAIISVDTRKAEVMRRAIAAGASIVNDVSALSHDPAALETVAELGCPVVLMHARGDPKTMQDDPRYDDVLLDVFDYLESRIEAATGAGVERARIIVDPGIGFGKTLEHNLELIAGMTALHALGVPLLIGASRKRFIGTISGVANAGERVHGSVAVALEAARQGAQILRVHDVDATRQALAVMRAVEAV
ncbi:MAG: dihydropteroate synthase [Rhizobiales bacterium]|nr:dihydropteroate synthase [Hyphomicrobiales bacterium]